MHPLSLSIERRQFLLGSAAFLGGATLVRAEEDLPRLPTLNEEMDRALRNAPLRLQFRGTTPKELANWQQEFATKLRILIGPHHPPERWSSEPLSSATLPDHTREEWLLKAEGVPSLPLYVLRPPGDKSKLSDCFGAARAWAVRA